MFCFAELPEGAIDHSTIAAGCARLRPILMSALIAISPWRRWR